MTPPRCLGPLKQPHGAVERPFQPAFVTAQQVERRRLIDGDAVSIDQGVITLFILRLSRNFGRKSRGGLTVAYSHNQTFNIRIAFAWPR